jgi:hypothetical protein
MRLRWYKERDFAWKNFTKLITVSTECAVKCNDNINSHLREVVVETSEMR